MFNDIEILLNKIDNIKIRFIILLLVIFLILPIIYFLVIISATKNYDTNVNFLYIIIFSIILFSIFLTASIYFVKTYKIDKSKILHDISFLNIIIDNTNDIIILLNELGEIINFNPALTENLKISSESVLGKPFRNIFNIIDNNENQNYRIMILEKLKEAFQGKVTEIISPIQISGEKEFHSIYFKLTPNFKNDDLSAIFVIGRLLQSDFITNNWLDNEKCTYIISNDLTLSNIFCYRLTRNLDAKLPRNEILFIQIALQEIIINAIEHGNLEIGYEKKTELKRRNDNYYELLKNESNKEYISDRRVRIDYSLESDRVVYVIKDDGKGFDWEKYLSDTDQSMTNQLLVDFHGLGLQMVKNSFDEVFFNDEGNEVTLIKYFKKSIQ